MGEWIEVEGRDAVVVDEDASGTWVRFPEEGGLLTLVRDGLVVRWTPAPEGPASSYTRAA